MSGPKRKNPFVQSATPTDLGENAVFVIGPITGHAKRNRRAFEDAQNRLQAAGLYALIPHDVIEEGSTWLKAVTAALHIIGQVQGVAVLDGATESTGSCIELLAAAKIGLPCLTVDEWISVLEEPE